MACCAQCRKAGPEHACSGDCGRCFCSEECQRAEWLASPLHRALCALSQPLGGVIIVGLDDPVKPVPPPRFREALEDMLGHRVPARPLAWTWEEPNNLDNSSKGREHNDPKPWDDFRRVFKKFLDTYWGALQDLAHRTGAIRYRDTWEANRWLREIKNDLAANGGRQDPSLLHQLFRYMPAKTRRYYSLPAVEASEGEIADAELVDSDEEVIEEEAPKLVDSSDDEEEQTVDGGHDPDEPAGPAWIVANFGAQRRGWFFNTGHNPASQRKYVDHSTQAILAQVDAGAIPASELPRVERALRIVAFAILDESATIEVAADDYGAIFDTFETSRVRQAVVDDLLYLDVKCFEYPSLAAVCTLLRPLCRFKWSVYS